MAASFTFRHGVEGSDPKPGEWVRCEMDYPGRPEDLKRVGIKAVICCPAGHLGSLVSHTIADDGTLNPSLVCGREGCGFHEWGRLEGWTPL